MRGLAVPEPCGTGPKRRVRLRIQTRTGLYFRLRPFLRRRGLWVGVLLFVPLLVWSQDLVWAVDAGSLTTGQRARAEAILREQVQLMPGSAVTQEKLTAGEYALLQSGEFSWASLNFLDGRLVVEAAAAKPVPDIAAGKADGVFAKAAGTVIRTNLVSGTMLAVPGQAVEAGQLLIGTSRTERDGTPIYEPAAGAVFAQFDWESTQEEPLKITAKQLTGKRFSKRVISTNGQRISLPSWKPFSEETALVTTRHIQPDILGFGLPFSVEETTYSKQTEQEIPYTKEQAVSRLQSCTVCRHFSTPYPDAAFVAQKRTFPSKTTFSITGSFIPSLPISAQSKRRQRARNSLPPFHTILIFPTHPSVAALPLYDTTHLQFPNLLEQ